MSLSRVVLLCHYRGDNLRIGRWSEREPDGNRPSGLRLPTVHAALDSNFGRAAHSDERIADLGSQGHFAGDVVAKRALLGFTTDEDQSLHRLVGEGAFVIVPALG